MADLFLRSKPGWGKKLVGALTRDQIETLLDFLGAVGALSHLPEELRTLDSDLAETLQRLASEENTVAADSEAAVSKQKLLEKWNTLWSRWNGYVSEVGDENGEYSIRERDWEPPYFNPTALADDLEKIAAEMRPMLERVSGIIDDAELFVKAAEEIDDNIASFPEWMQGEEWCELGPHCTVCTLEWTWRTMERQELAMEQFLERIYKLDKDACSVCLDPEASLDFFASLPESVCSKIYADLSQEKFAVNRDDVDSIWHLIHRQYEQRFDPAAYLRSSEKHLGSDWRYGESLIAAAISRGDFPQAESFVERTFASLLRTKEPWRPEDRFLQAGHCYGPVPKLLKTWEMIAAQQGNQARAAACRIQSLATVSATDWSAMLNAFSEFESQGGTRATGEKFFAEWRDTIVERCRPYRRPDARPADFWVYWLIEARRNPPAHRSSLFDHLKKWLGRFAESPAFFQENWQSLALLTRNLPSGEQVKARYPTFYVEVLTARDNLDATLEKSLRDSLTLLAVETTEIEPMSIWQQHLHLLVPSPDLGGSAYESQALMMKVMTEVNRVSYDRMIAEWKTVYRRRRNLWAELAALKLPGL